MKINMNTIKSSGVSLHFEKHKANDTAVNGLQRHNERVPNQKHSNKNIDDSRTIDNVFLKKSDGKFKDAVSNVIENERDKGLKGVRKDAVRMVEATVQISGKVLDMGENEQEQVLRDSYEWLKSEFGENNIVSAVIHKDETNMHLHFDFVPIRDSKLTAKTVISKIELKRYQNEFLSDLQGKHPTLNFERGGGETNGLSQREFEILQKEREEREKELSKYSDKLDSLEDELDKKEDLLKAKESKLLVREKRHEAGFEKLNNAVKEFNVAVEELKEEKRDVLIREKNVSNRESLLKSENGRLVILKQEIDEKSLNADKKLSEASERLSEANKLKELADDMMKRVEALKIQLASSWNNILSQVRGGALKVEKVEQIAEKYKPVSDENVNEMLLDMNDLLDKNTDMKL